MGLPRSNYYAAPEGRPSDLEIVAQIRAITDEFECYGYRRVGAELRHRGHVVNAKKVRRLMREHDLDPRRRRRFTRTTDSDHDGPIYPFVARDFEVHGPDQLWVADLTYVAIATGFVYVAVILDAWSRRAVGYAIGRSLDARHAVAAFERAVALRRPLPGCVFHSDRGSQYASEKHRAILDRYGLIGSMSRRGNPYDNPKAESFMKTLKVEAVYLAEYDTYEDRRRPSPLHRRGLQRQETTFRPGLSQPHPVRGPQRPHPCQKRRLIPSNDRGALHIGVEKGPLWR